MLTFSALAPARLATLPREARDTLFLLLVIAWVILPHVANLPWWCSFLAGLVLAWLLQRAGVQVGEKVTMSFARGSAEARIETAKPVVTNSKE